MTRLPLPTSFCLLLLATVPVLAENPFDVEVVASFDEPWALTFLPDGRMLVTEKKGRLYIVDSDGQSRHPSAACRTLTTADRVVWATSRYTPNLRITERFI